EYEPIFHANSSTRAVLESAYRLPHVPIFNTAALQHHFQAEGLGIYDPDYREPQRPPALVFEHAICDLSPPSREALERRTVRKLLFYARPERHAERNLFAVGLLALRQALAKGYFPGPWEFHGIGTLIARCRVDLGEGRNLHIVPRVSQAQYEQFVPGFDVGLSLMMAPHPSVLPFEMLSAGMVVVTNTYGHRRKEFFAGISPNLVPCLPEVDSVAEGLRQAAAKATDTDARLRDATVAWNRSWDEAFSPAFIRRLLAAMDGVATPAPAPAADSEDA
ncbi:MAG: hypothetical protein KGY81_05035, partial [Phycisphaerae bacterium]|nr:hypothetical protein [Phycisphaerae bacterium]